MLGKHCEWIPEHSVIHSQPLSLCVPLGFLGQSGMRSACSGQGRAGSGCCRDLWGEGRLLSPPPSLPYLFCSPCLTWLSVISLTSGQEFFSDTLHPNQTDSPWSLPGLSIISTASCLQCVHVEPADILCWSSTSKNLTGLVKDMFCWTLLLSKH